MNTTRKSLIVKISPEERLKIVANIIIDRILEETAQGKPLETFIKRK